MSQRQKLRADGLQLLQVETRHVHVSISMLRTRFNARRLAPRGLLARQMPCATHGIHVQVLRSESSGFEEATLMKHLVCSDG